jgi:hypothetical protein
MELKVLRVTLEVRWAGITVEVTRIGGMEYTIMKLSLFWFWDE